MKFTTYKFLIAGGLVAWGILNLTNGFNLFDENALNLLKGLCGLEIGFVIAFAKTELRVSRQTLL